MKSPDRSSKVTRFLAPVAIGWVGLVHVTAFGIFGVTPLAGWILVGGLAVTVAGILGYLAWEFRQAKTLEVPEASQDVSLLMLTRHARLARPVVARRTRTRLTGSHPVTDRVASLHLPPHIDRRRRMAGETRTLAEPLIELSADRLPVTPSAN